MDQYWGPSAVLPEVWSPLRALMHCEMGKEQQALPTVLQQVTANSMLLDTMCTSQLSRCTQIFGQLSLTNSYSLVHNWQTS